MIPQNELGVIVVFAQQCEQAGFEIVSVQSGFPDAIVRKDGRDYRVEFEYQASNFRTHKHDIRETDLIVCWKHNTDFILPVLALSDSDWAETSLDLPTEDKREAVYWEQRATSAERKLESAYREIEGVRLDRNTPSVPVMCDLCGSMVTNGNMGSHRRWHCVANAEEER